VAVGFVWGLAVANTGWMVYAGRGRRRGDQSYWRYAVDDAETLLAHAQLIGRPELIARAEALLAKARSHARGRTEAGE
jgi:hypothetical protein